MTVLHLGRPVELFRDMFEEANQGWGAFVHALESLTEGIAELDGVGGRCRVGGLRVLRGAGATHLVLTVIPSDELLRLRAEAMSRVNEIFLRLGVRDPSRFLLASPAVGAQRDGSWVPHVTVVSGGSKAWDDPLRRSLGVCSVEFGGLALHGSA